VGDVTVQVLSREGAIVVRRVVARAGAMLAALAVASLVVTGCSAAPVSPPPAPTEAEIDAAMTEYVEQNVDARDATYPEVWESIRFERFIAMDEAPEMLGGCVAEFGVTTATFNTDGSSSWSDLPNSTYVSTVVDACTLQYPYDFLKTYVHSEAQNAYLYNYGVNFVQPCLAAAGLEPGTPPGRDTYQENVQQGLYAWSPYNTVDFSGWLRGSGNLGQYPPEEMMLFLQQRCPASPAGMEPIY